jgi:hypothetical protein
MSFITLAQLAEIVPDLRILALTVSQNEYRFFLKKHPSEFGLIAIGAHHSVRGIRFDPLPRWTCSSLPRIWSKKRGSRRVS